MSTTDLSAPRRLYIPALAPLYGALHTLSETLLRVAAGGILIVHGWPKIQAPTGLAGMLGGQGLPAPEFLSVLVSLTEFVGGILLVIGFLTRPAAVAATILLLVAAWFHWVAFGQGFTGAEFPLLWAAVAFFFAIRGGNAHSVDTRIGRAF